MAKRVQDRRRVKDKTNMIEDVTTVKRLGMGDELRHIFELWGICLGVSLLVFMLEFTGAYRLVINKMRHCLQGGAKRKVGACKISTRVIKIAPAVTSRSIMPQGVVLR